MDKNKKLAKATIVFGYLFSVITIAAAIYITITYFKEYEKKNGLGDILLLLLAIAIAMIVTYMTFAIVYSSLLLVKTKKIDGIINKKSKTIDLICSIVNLALAIVALIMVSLRGFNDTDSSKLATVITLGVCFDISVIVTLFSTIYNTIQYKKVLMPLFNKKQKTTAKK